jgi:hypothetical protein
MVSAVGLSPDPGFPSVFDTGALVSGCDHFCIYLSAARTHGGSGRASGGKACFSSVDRVLGTFGARRSSKTGFNSIPAVQCVNRYPQTKVGIAVDRNNTKVDSEPKVRAGKLRRDSKEWNRLKDEKAIQTSIGYYRVIIKCKGHECNFVRAVSRVYK